VEGQRTYGYEIFAEACTTGLKISPFFVMELPRMTKLPSRSKSISIVEVLSAPTSIAFASTILIPLRAALGKVTDGELDPVSSIPFFSFTADRASRGASDCSPMCYGDGVFERAVRGFADVGGFDAGALLSDAKSGMCTTRPNACVLLEYPATS